MPSTPYFAAMSIVVMLATIALPIIHWALCNKKPTVRQSAIGFIIWLALVGVWCWLAFRVYQLEPTWFTDSADSMLFVYAICSVGAAVTLFIGFVSPHIPVDDSWHQSFDDD